PPGQMARIRLDRFSPNFDRAAEWGLDNVRPLYAYRHIYPFPPETTARLVHYFDFDYADGRAPSQYTSGLRRAVAEWHAQAGQARLELHEDGDRLEILDTRPGAARPLTVLAGPERLAYLGLDAGATLDGLHAELKRSLGEAAPSPAQLQGWLTDWL